jgi:amino acid adenylation domain-containing protein
MVVAVLAVLKAGGAYVPIDPALPLERQRLMFEDTEPALVVTESGMPPLPFDGGVVVLDLDRPEIDARPTSPPEVEHRPGGLAYVIFTSGTTGRPNGVEIEHRSVANLLEAMRGQPGLDEDDVVAFATTFAFDPSVVEIFLPLVVGARLVVVSQQVAADPVRLGRLLNSAGVTFMQATPTMWRMLVEHGWRAPPGFRAVSGAEPLRERLAAELLGKGVELWNLYGPTETTVWASALSIQVGEQPRLGGPMPNVTFQVVDEQLRPVADGTAGELLIGGAGVARGYRNRPELTAARFVPDPCGATGSRAYRSGDVVRRRSDGTLDFLGRTDHQVKHHGFRVELAEIESVLERHHDVRACAASALEGAAEDTVLVAYVVLAPGATSTLRDLREHLRKWLPAYMVPSRIVPLERLPLTSTGKVDRHALPALAEVEPPTEPGHDGPTGPVEPQLTGIWRDLLHADAIGREDDFFDLGGDSVRATQALLRIEQELGTRLPLTVFYDRPTIAGLAAAIERERVSPQLWPLLVPLREQGARPPLFLVQTLDAELLSYRELVRRLDRDQPVYGLDAAGADGRRYPHIRIESMAAEYLVELRRFQPTGPYLLGGFCFGGTVAYEMARQLTTAGEEIRLLAMIDPDPVGHKDNPRRTAAFPSRERSLLPWAAKVAGWSARRLRHAARWWAFRVFTGLRAPLPERLGDPEVANQEALRAYAMPVTDFPVTMFNLATPTQPPVPESVWREFMKGDLEIRLIETELELEEAHTGLLRGELVTELADRFNSALAEALASG